MHSHLAACSEAVHATAEIPVIYSARYAFLAHNFCAIQFMSEASHTTFHSYIRMRTGKRQADTPIFAEPASGNGSTPTRGLGLAAVERP